MGSGFATWKDILDVAVVPLALGLAALLWPAAENFLRRRSFQRLIVRELRELAPEPESARAGLTWVEHQRKQFVHKRIFDEVSTNRDFILSLPAHWIYPVSQLWIARQAEDGEQWLFYLEKLAARKYDGSGEVDQVFQKWQRLIHAYRPPPTGKGNKV